METTFENAKHLGLAFVLLMLVMSVGGAIFSLAEGWSFFDAFYFSFVAMTTIGYGDFSPMVRRLLGYIGCVAVCVCVCARARARASPRDGCGERSIT